MSKKTKIILFSSKNCGPCAVLKPLVIEQQKQRGFELETHTLEDGADIFAEYKIRAVPVVIAMNGAKEVGRITGATTGLALINHLDKWGV
jgi:thioredoxin-like negative regulator of GroEL